MKIPTFAEMIALVTTSGLRALRDLRCGTRGVMLGRRVGARGETAGVLFDRGSGGGTEGGGKLTGLVWHLLGVGSMC